MHIHDYCTASGKNLIKEYLKSLPKPEMYIGFRIRQMLVTKGLAALNELDTRQLKGKLWEIKFSQNRIMYVIVNSDNIHMLHACKKQKGKAERFNIETAMKRAKRQGLAL